MRTALTSSMYALNNVERKVNNIKVLTNEKRGGLDRSPFKLFSLRFSNNPCRPHLVSVICNQELFPNHSIVLGCDILFTSYTQKKIQNPCYQIRFCTNVISTGAILVSFCLQQHVLLSQSMR
jgi:hypothetical protein